MGGYVAFDQAKNGVTTPQAPANLPLLGSEDAPQPSGGYITVAKASQMESASSPKAEAVSQAFVPPSNPMAYSKVGIERLPPIQHPGYTHPSLLMGNGGQNLESNEQKNPHQSEQQQLPALPLSEHYSKVSVHN